MIVYSLVMLAVCAVVTVVSAQIYKGKTELIHQYHQQKVTDKAAYAKAFGKALAVSAGAMALSGIIALFGETAMWCAVGVLVSGLALSIAAIVRVQKKYNGGVF